LTGLENFQLFSLLRLTPGLARVRFRPALLGLFSVPAPLFDLLAGRSAGFFFGSCVSLASVNRAADRRNEAVFPA
jgi:hypothetical protein